MVYLNQNFVSLYCQNVGENLNIFILFEQRGNVLQSIHRDFFMEYEIRYKEFARNRLLLIKMCH